MGLFSAAEKRMAYDEMVRARLTDSHKKGRFATFRVHLRLFRASFVRLEHPLPIEFHFRRAACEMLGRHRSECAFGQASKVNAAHIFTSK